MRAVITNISELSPTVKGFSFEVESRGSGGSAAAATAPASGVRERATVMKPSFLAGQWVDFFIPGVEQIGGYSMCSAPSDLTGAEGRLDLAVKASAWAPAAWMHNRAKVGDVVQMRVGEEGLLHIGARSWCSCVVICWRQAAASVTPTRRRGAQGAAIV